MSEGRARPEALGEFRNDFGAIDGDGMWRYKINGSSGRWIRDRQRVRGLISLGQRKPDKPTTSCAWEERQETWSSVQEPKMSTACQHRRRTRSGVKKRLSVGSPGHGRSPCDPMTSANTTSPLSNLSAHRGARACEQWGVQRGEHHERGQRGAHHERDRLRTGRSAPRNQCSGLWLEPPMGLWGQLLARWPTMC